LLDRIDIHVDVPAVPYKDLSALRSAESSAAIRERVGVARAAQADRFKRLKLHCNAQMGSRHIKRFCHIGDGSQRLLETAIDKLGLSARAYSRILKIARSIADLSDGGDIAVEHVSEAIQYRSLDRGRIRSGGII
jgi:magnesium chelatase family protein